MLKLMTLGQLTSVYDSYFLVQELEASQDASQRLSYKFWVKSSVRSQLFELAQTDAERLVNETDMCSMWSSKFKRVVHLSYILPPFMGRLETVDFLVDGKFSVIFGIIDIDLERDVPMLFLKISAQPDGRC